ncbi:hypothetical protein WN944_016373 [Citrus x changshan-huyou]|uniref:Uncharacterized protein n=1 Tax=Citrus x changshan-huyou TaxID=2935761 RepID=A0AAP0QRY6_9ROSI
MKGVQFPVASVLLVLACSLAIASDPSRLQDFCVAINDFNIKTCGHNIPKSIANQVGSTVTTTNVEQILGHNTTRHNVTYVATVPGPTSGTVAVCGRKLR